MKRGRGGEYNAKHRWMLTKQTYRFITAESQIFCVSDIVEIQLSIVAVSMRKLQQKMKLKLRTVAMLDESFMKVSHDAPRTNEDIDTYIGACSSHIPKRVDGQG